VAAAGRLDDDLRSDGPTGAEDDDVHSFTDSPAATTTSTSAIPADANASTSAALPSV
jgi:hypothetical protein